MRYDTVIFDLDGTLLNTLGDLRNAVNHALGVFGHAPRTLDEVRLFVGNGVANLIKRAMPENSAEDEISKALKEFRAFYGAHINVETVPYPGIIELLKNLRAAGVKVCVNSNKYDAALQKLCAEHFAGLYDFALGESEATPKKPSPAAALRLIEMAGGSRAIYVGDSSVDIETATNAGIDAAWVSWGFRTREDMGEMGKVPAFDDARALGEYLLK